MGPLLETVLALLAAAGLLWLCWLLFERLCAGGPDWGGTVYAVVPAEGDGERLEGEVRRLVWLRGGRCRLSIIIADGGLSPAGRAAATALLARNPGLVICPLDRLGEYIGRP